MTIDRRETDLRGEPFAPTTPPPGTIALRCAGAKGGARLDAETRRRIGRNLRLLYGDVLDQPLPARFEALLADLCTRSESGGSS